jgi:hypothetical protein
MPIAWTKPEITLSTFGWLGLAAVPLLGDVPFLPLEYEERTQHRGSKPPPSGYAPRASARQAAGGTPPVFALPPLLCELCRTSRASRWQEAAELMGRIQYCVPVSSSPYLRPYLRPRIFGPRIFGWKEPELACPARREMRKSFRRSLRGGDACLCSHLECNKLASVTILGRLTLRTARPICR